MRRNRAERPCDKRPRASCCSGGGHNPQSKIRNPKSGITLIELLVGLGVITIIFLALGLIFQQAVDATNVGTGQGEIHQQARAVFDYLGQELRGIPRDGRVVIASPSDALSRWGVGVHGDVLAFTTATVFPVRHSGAGGVASDADPPTDANFGAVCYYRWYPSAVAPPAQQILYRTLDRLDLKTQSDTVNILTLGILDPRPYDPPVVQDLLALRAVTPTAGGSTIYGAFEVDYYDTATGRFLPVTDLAEGAPGTLRVYDSAQRGLPRAIRVHLRLQDRRMHVRDEVRRERGAEFEETFWIPAAN